MTISPISPSGRFLRSVNFGQSVDVVQLDAKLGGNAVTHFLAPALRTDDAFFQVDLVFDATLADFLRQQQSIGGCGAQHRGLQIHHHLQLLFRVARPHGNRHSAQLLAAVLEADAGSPQSVAWCDLHPVLVGHAGKLIAPLEHLAPVIHIFGGIRDDHRCARGAGRGVDADNVLVRYAL